MTTFYSIVTSFFVRGGGRRREVRIPIYYDMVEPREEEHEELVVHCM
jgi:hypothetical protein